ncbi:unnamed protein product [Cunninghamella blakesleeana]
MKSFMIVLLFLCFCILKTSSHSVQLQAPKNDYIAMNVYTRSNNQGIVQHIRYSSIYSSTSCFNLQSKHIGSINLNDSNIKLTFYRSKDCMGSPIRNFKPTCTHSQKLILRAQSVSIQTLESL